MTEALARALEERLRPEAADRTDDLILAARAAVGGGVAAMAYYGAGDLRIRDKGIDDPVTAADHAANDAILDTISSGGVSEPVLSEESTPPAGVGAAERFWVVDPLDGTKEFIEGIGEFSVMVGLAEGGRAVAGALYQPDPGVLYLGAAVEGGWAVETPRRDPRVRRLEVGDREDGPLRFARSRSHPDARIRRLEAELGRLGDEGGGRLEILESGSVGVKCALVATGRADLYVHPVPYLKEWDTCAPEAVLRGAGGTVTDCAGRPLRYGKPDARQPAGIFAARPGVWSRVAPLVRAIADAPYEG